MVMNASNGLALRKKHSGTRAPSGNRAPSGDRAQSATEPAPGSGGPSVSFETPDEPEEEEEPFPTAWNDVSYDVAGIKSLVSEGGFTMVALVVTSFAALIAIGARAGPVPVFWLSFLGLLPLAIQLGDLTEILSAWRARSSVCLSASLALQ